MCQSTYEIMYNQTYDERGIGCPVRYNQDNGRATPLLVLTLFFNSNIELHLSIDDLQPLRT